jgi:hypothetical protein
MSHWTSHARVRHARQILWLMIIRMRITFQCVYTAPFVRFSLHYSSRYIESSVHTSQEMRNVSIRQTNLLIFYCRIPLRCMDLPFGIHASFAWCFLFLLLQETQKITNEEKRKRQPKAGRRRIKYTKIQKRLMLFVVRLI